MQDEAQRVGGGGVEFVHIDIGVLVKTSVYGLRDFDGLRLREGVIRLGFVNARSVGHQQVCRCRKAALSQNSKGADPRQGVFRDGYLQRHAMSWEAGLSVTHRLRQFFPTCYGSSDPITIEHDPQRIAKVEVPRY